MYFIFRKFMTSVQGSKWSLPSKDIVGMFLILGMSYIFKVVTLVIGLVAILVIDRFSGHPRADKGPRNQPVNKESLEVAVLSQCDALIAALGSHELEDSTCNKSSSTIIVNESIKAPHSAKIANFVARFIAFNHLPSFGFHNRSILTCNTSTSLSNSSFW